MSAVLGIDPGTRKVGYALVARSGTAIEQGIVALEEIDALVRRLAGNGAIEAIALGHGTNAEGLRERLLVLGVPMTTVDERETTLRARALYFQENPPRGWRRLIPLGMQLPPRPVDDYAAVLIARRYLEGA